MPCHCAHGRLDQGNLGMVCKPAAQKTHTDRPAFDTDNLRAQGCPRPQAIPDMRTNVKAQVAGTNKLAIKMLHPPQL